MLTQPQLCTTDVRRHEVHKDSEHASVPNRGQARSVAAAKDRAASERHNERAMAQSVQMAICCVRYHSIESH